MRKKTTKELLAEQEATMHKVLEAIGVDAVLEYLVSEFESDQYYTDDTIERERAFARENRTGAYQSAGVIAARQTIKHLQRIKREQKELQVLVRKIIAQKGKIEKLEQR